MLVRSMAKALLILTAIFEAATGLLLMIWPSEVLTLLIGPATTAPLGPGGARVAGVVLLALRRCLLVCPRSWAETGWKTNDHHHAHVQRGCGSVARRGGYQLRACRYRLVAGGHRALCAGGLVCGIASARRANWRHLMLTGRRHYFLTAGFAVSWYRTRRARYRVVLDLAEIAADRGEAHVSCVVERSLRRVTPDQGPAS